MTLKILGSKVLDPAWFGISWFPDQKHWAISWRSLRFDDSRGFQIGGNGVNFYLVPKRYAKLFSERRGFGWIHRVDHVFIVIDPSEVKTVLGEDIMVVSDEFLEQGLVFLIQVVEGYLFQEDLFLVLTTSFPEVAADIWQLATLQPDMKNQITLQK